MPSYRAGTTHKNKKRYPRVTAGPLRDQRIHRIVAAALLGRDLKRDEEVHHKDGNRLNFKWDNLLVLGNKDHGWVSAKQAWYMREMDVKLKKEWDEFMDAEAKQFDETVQVAKAAGVPYEAEDGHMRERWEQRGADATTPF